MKLNKLVASMGAALLASTLVACGGGGSTANRGGGIGGSGIALSNHYSGVISGFGSIYVNGVRFNTDNSQFFVNGKAVEESALAVGMVVRVEGAATGDAGVANKVYFDAGLEGPISGALIVSHREQIILPVMGVEVVLHSGKTKFEGATFAELQQNADLLAVGAMVELSGFYNGQGQFEASFFELEAESFVANVSEVQVIGRVSKLTATEFALVLSPDVAPLTISLAAVNFDGELKEGEQVKVEGTLNAFDSQTVLALELDKLSPQDSQEVELQGLISSLTSQEQFTLNGIPVDASKVKLKSSLSVNMLVEVEGVMQQGVLIAESIDVLRSDEEPEFDLAARVESIDLDAKTITLSVFDQLITVAVNARTSWDDERDDVRRFNLNDVAVGDYLEVEMTANDGAFVAQEIEREEGEDGSAFEAKLTAENLDAAKQQVNIAGLTFTLTPATEIEGDLDLAEFFAKAHQFDEVVFVDSDGDQQIDKILLDD